VIVVDTNILAYRWLPGSRNAEADALLARDSDWCAPLLWRSEFRNILAGFMRRSALSLADAERTMGMAWKSLRGGEHAVGDAEVLALVDRSRCTAYDCEFVALALALKRPLVTDDQVILGAFPDIAISLADACQRPETG